MTKLTRLEKALGAIHDCGFESLEDLATEYYTSDLSGSPRLASTRRLSRSRKLPVLLASFHPSSAGWTKWETTRYHDEILREAEVLLLNERKRLLEHQQLQELLRQRDMGDEISGIIQDEVSSISFLSAG